MRHTQQTKTKTADQVFEIKKTCNLLTQSIRQYYDCRKVYIPGLTSVGHGEGDDKLESQPEVLKLWLPSQLPAEHRFTWCLPGIPDLELRFRYAQVDDSLADLRRHLRLLHLARDQNAKHTKSTSSTTRSQGIIDGFRSKINRLASQYRNARQALFTLDPAQRLAAHWGQYFLPLEDRDLRAPMRDETQPSEGRTQYSWIWITPRAPLLSSTSTSTPFSNPQPTAPTPISPPLTQMTDIATSDTDSQDFDRVHWAKCQARAERYEEEVQLTVEEMGRTLQYFEWKRDWWLSLVPNPENSDYPPDIQDGLRAYAYRQSHLYDELITLYVTRWKAYLSARSLGSLWLGKYSSRVDPHPMRPSRGHPKVYTDSTPLANDLFLSSELSADSKPIMDAPLDSGSDEDLEGEHGVDADGEIEENLDAEEMFADD